MASYELVGSEEEPAQSPTRVEGPAPAAQLWAPSPARAAAPWESGGEAAPLAPVDAWDGEEGIAASSTAPTSRDALRFTRELVEGEPRIFGQAVSRRAVWAGFIAAASLVLVLSCSADGTFLTADGRVYLHYSVDPAFVGDYGDQAPRLPYPDLPPRVGFRCTRGGGASAVAAVVLSLLCVGLSLAAMLLSVALQRRSAPAGSFAPPSLPPFACPPGVEGAVAALRRASAALAALCLILWLSHISLLVEIRGACGREMQQTNYLFGPAATYAERGYELKAGVRSWNGSLYEGIAQGVFRDGGLNGFYVRYDESAALRAYTAGRRANADQGAGRQPHLYGPGIAAAFLGALALALQAPAVLLTERAGAAAAARVSAARQRDMEMHSRMVAAALGSGQAYMLPQQGWQGGGALGPQPVFAYAQQQPAAMGQPAPAPAYFYPQQGGYTQGALPQQQAAASPAFLQ